MTITRDSPSSRVCWSNDEHVTRALIGLADNVQPATTVRVLVGLFVKSHLEISFRGDGDDFIRKVRSTAARWRTNRLINSFRFDCAYFFRWIGPPLCVSCFYRSAWTAGKKVPRGTEFFFYRVSRCWTCRYFPDVVPATRLR